ncbi:ribosome biogenesis GTPase YlqF [Aquabacterium sp. A08]|uniref:ribosome biogenesis GTPase YlqF n=1 Tax=Aquabacterium sp. A08 TaxID=2718532 RepID=UPI001421C21A|nr:ribosome biogenesis GTPase YlqF [Aquabacterium sp. A08]NIC43028.1 ribosome biogenesis GTPase YlqF [Aquabacterium sp. A08]
MSVQWFPGHMHATKKAILERIKEIDVVIEMLDARLPGSSANPMLAQLIAGKPTLKVLNKQDLADPARTALWLAHYNAQPETRAIGLHAGTVAPVRAIIAACRELAPLRGGMVKPLRVLIGGIPNVGKSTLINTLVGKRATKTGDEAGITKQEQRIALADDFYLYDTPGMLWPKILVPESGYHLAASGAVGRNAYDEEEVALELLKTLKGPYGAQLEARYKWGWVPEAVAQRTEDELLTAVGRKRGALLPGGRLNAQKAAETLLTDFRTGALGPITLETPEEHARWLQAALRHEAELAAERQARQAARRGGSRRDPPGA